MKLRKIFYLLISALVASTALSFSDMTAHAQTGEIAQGASALDFSKLATSHFESGNWFWGILNEPELLGGATAVATDVNAPSIFYVGGPGYIATSTNSGVSWQVTRQFDATFPANDETQSENKESSFDVRLEGLREYIRNGLEEQYDESYVDTIMDNISDDDLRNAETLEDIEALEGLELDMETDLSQVQIASDLESSIVLSEFDSFIQRYTTLIVAGADTKSAILTAASSSAVWDFVTTPKAVYAVNSDCIYFSTDHGSSWNIFYSSATADSKILSFDVSNDGLIVAIGMSDTLLLTRNGGADWADLSHVFDGAIFKVVVPERVEDPVLVLTTEGLYFSRDMGLTWHELIIPIAINERILDVIPRFPEMYVLTEQALYHSSNGNIWNHIPLGPISDETVQQVIIPESENGRLIARTNNRVFEYNNGWKLYDASLMAVETGPLVLLNDGESLAMMATSTGVWLAQDKAKIEVSSEYQELYDTWAKEPSDDLVIEWALRAHYLDEWLEKRWSLRSRMAWLLPTVTFDYLFRQTVSPDIYSVTNMRFAVVESERYRYEAEEIHQWQIMARWNIEIDKAFKTDISSTQLTNRLRVKRYALIKQVQAMIKKRRAFQLTLALDFPKTQTKSKKNSQKHIRNLLGLQEIDANLNYLTGGYFIPAIQESHKKH